jgi:hypothetical protein
MGIYRKMAEEALRKANTPKKVLVERVVYPEGLVERMHAELEDDLANGTHSLSKSPIFPEDDESSFEQKIMGRRFNDVAKRFKRAYDVNAVNEKDLISGMSSLIKDTVDLEKEHTKALEKLAVDMIRKEFDMDESVVELNVELTPTINMVGTKKNAKPIAVEMAFNKHDDMVKAKDEVYKRRFINAMIQGSAKKASHMFHMVDDELNELNPRLGNKYSKLMASGDYMYYVLPKMDEMQNAGIVRVQFPTKDNPKAIIHVQAMVFPVLVHELVKGVMELMSAHGLPKNKKLGEYVINKADFLAAEPWDMRLGPALWEQFTDAIDDTDLDLKYYIYTDLISLPVKDFNIKMREIMGGTKMGKKIIKELVDTIKEDLKNDDFDQSMANVQGDDEITHTDVEGDDGFDFDELMNGLSDNESTDESDGYDFDELL